MPEEWVICVIAREMRELPLTEDALLASLAYTLLREAFPSDGDKGFALTLLANCGWTDVTQEVLDDFCATNAIDVGEPAYLDQRKRAYRLTFSINWESWIRRTLSHPRAKVLKKEKELIVKYYVDAKADGFTVKLDEDKQLIIMDDGKVALDETVTSEDGDIITEYQNTYDSLSTYQGLKEATLIYDLQMTRYWSRALFYNDTLDQCYFYQYPLRNMDWGNIYEISAHEERDFLLDVLKDFRKSAETKVT